MGAIAVPVATMARPLALAALITTLLAPLLAGCQPPRPAGNVVVGSRNRIDSIDPAQAYSIGTMQVLSALGDTLYSVGANGEAIPRLATALPRLSADGLTARVALRAGVRFHDGTPFNAAAMAFTLERFLAIGKLSYLLGDRVVAVRAVAPLELELRLRRPYTPLPQLLSAVNLTPLSPTAYRQHQKAPLNNRFVGTGPYTLSFFSNQQQRLKPFAGYWGRPPANRGVDLVTLSNSTALYGALRSGEIDVLLSTSLEGDHQSALQRSAGRGELRQGVGPALEIGYLTLLTDRPPFHDPRLRQAVAYSLDRPTLSERVTLGLRAPLRDLVPPTLPGSDPQAWPDYNPAAARRLYRQAGYCNGRRLSLPLTFRSNIPADRLFALTWQAQLRRDLGDCVTLEVTGMEATTAYRQLGDGTFPMILLDWSGDFPDADNYLMPLLDCDKAKGDRCLEGASAASGSFWTAPGLVAELERSSRIAGDDRRTLLQRLQQRTAAANPYLPLWLVAPRAWARTSISPPRFDGSGRLVLADLQRLGEPVEAGR
ncbi:MAG: ABC transporter substrate-binding protein [Cyanobacteriota bacterium]|nr:ABC transporter substrate-binding protein [Cyanobacteriota bacterium]